MDLRRAATNGLFDTSGLGLEIGPSYNPLFPKRDGYNVEVLDHATADDLRAKYARTATVNTSLIEDVDHVWDGRPISDICGRGRFDYIVASHVIEHTPDLLGFLQECRAMLAPSGTLFLVVPDKRRCFDLFRPLSTTGQVLQAHEERRRFHAPATAFDAVAYSVTMDGSAAWSAASGGALQPAHSLAQAATIYERNRSPARYEDFHAWTFVPSSFRLIVKHLAHVAALDLHEVFFQPTQHAEFYIGLRPGPPGPVDTYDLLLSIERELRDAQLPENDERVANA